MKYTEEDKLHTLEVNKEAISNLSAADYQECEKIFDEHYELTRQFSTVFNQRQSSKQVLFNAVKRNFESINKKALQACTTATKNDEDIYIKFNPEIGKKYQDALSKLKTNLSTLPADAKAVI